MKSPLHAQRGLTLIELMIALVISAIIMASLSNLMKLGLDTQITVQTRSELAYRGQLAIERISDSIRATEPKILVATGVTDTTGDWLAPAGCTGSACLMLCRKATTNELIETTTADTACTGTNVLSNFVSYFSVSLPNNTGPVDHPSILITLELNDYSTSHTLSLSSAVRLGDGT